MKKFKSALLLSGFVAPLVLGVSAAHAQDQTAASSATEAAPAVRSDEIIVTAQFREQRVQDTPLAISAFNAEGLADRGITDVTSAGKLAPNVSLTKGAGVGGSFGQFAAAFIRGVGQGDIHFAVEPGVGMYLDDAYYGVMSGAVFELLDIDRVEVLRGPQGTLSGKNSIGGSIKVFSVKPDDEANGYVEVGYGSRDLVTGRAASNVTLIEDKLFARIAVAGRYRDGYVDRLDYACATGAAAPSTRLMEDCKIGSQGGEQVWSARATLRWLPTDGVENTLILDTVQDNSENSPTKLVSQGALWAGSNNYITGPRDYTNYENYVVRPTGPLSGPNTYTLPSNTPMDGKGLTNTLSIELSDSVNLTSITSYRTSDVRVSSSLDASPASLTDQFWRLYHKQFTQELRLAGQVGDILDWTVGGYYYDAKGVSEGRVTLPGGFELGGGGVNLDTIFHDPVRTKSKSAFVHTIWHPVPQMDVIAAVRYTDDSKEFTFNRYDWKGDPHPALLSLVDFTGTFKGDRLDYRAGLSYRWTEDLMTYVQYSTGFKGGGVNPRPFFSSQAVGFGPETIQAYEAGFKSQFFDRALTLNAAVFLNKFKDLQSGVNRCDDISPFPAAPCSAIRNVGDAEIKGAEAEITLIPVEGLRFSANLGYLDYKYTRTNALAGITADMKPAYIPEFSAALGLEYEIPLGLAGFITPRVDYTYRSSVETAAINLPGAALPALGLWNAGIRWESYDEDWSVNLVVTNLANKFYFEAMNFSNAPTFIGNARLGAPRSWSLSVKRKF